MVGRKFSVEFKPDAVEIVRGSGKSIAEVAHELGIHDSSLGIWVRITLNQGGLTTPGQVAHMCLIVAGAK